jgi:hypothetical protein
MLAGLPLMPDRNRGRAAFGLPPVQQPAPSLEGAVPPPNMGRPVTSADFRTFNPPMAAAPPPVGPQDFARPPQPAAAPPMQGPMMPPQGQPMPAPMFNPRTQGDADLGGYGNPNALQPLPAPVQIGRAPGMGPSQADLDEWRRALDAAQFARQGG